MITLCRVETVCQCVCVVCVCVSVDACVRLHVPMHIRMHSMHSF